MPAPYSFQKFEKYIKINYILKQTTIQSMAKKHTLIKIPSKKYKIFVIKKI